ncbi:protein disulfide isomerase [Cyclospora cayetanensis]|uniref:Protein disulfide-isomerase n=1 Tax=Cyclospora cayetanensis TaxID=88456 RepID=A0A1D3CV74_9EIME|nr:protein disulfide isomerase [Cyclospora cayetanensis]
MKRHLFLALALVAVLSCLSTGATEAPAAAEAVEGESDVLVMTKANFDETLSNNEVVLVKFYAPWCGHCKRMAPEYASAAKILKEKGSKVVLGKVDATAETDLADKNEINEFPTLTLFRNKKPEQYTGGRSADAIVQWIEMMTGPAVTEIEGDVKDEVTKDSPVAFYGEFSSKQSDAAKIFETVANESRQLGKFYAKYTGEDKISAVRYEEGAYPFEGKTTDEFKTFVEVESFPLFGPINGENFRKYVQRDASLVWFCGTEKDFDAHKASIREAAKESRNVYYFVWLDTDTFKGHAEGALGVTEFPSLVAQTKKGRFILEEPSTTMKDSAKVAQFLKDVTDGKVERSLKSDPIPETNDEAVKVVVGKTFEQMVLSEEKDVFLEVYAPWCGYCKSFEPIYKEFAEKIQDNENVVVAKMDGITNEAPLDAFDWKSFPTIYFVKAGEKTPMKYEGSRTVDGLMEFLEKNASKPIAKKADKGEEL